ncbi:MAG TPA: tetratricopeptide repeat protein [Terriglobales bacterium]|nr:tetratricopeptide repeat protein [Terriglobales bacterium]
MKLLRTIAVAALISGIVAPASAQSAVTLARTLLILPFENASQAPGLEWISESFPELLGERMTSLKLYVVARQDRDSAFDRAGIPENAKLSRATLYLIAEQMDVDYVVLGNYDYDGKIFRATAQLLDMKQLHLSPELQESGTLPKMVDVEGALAWDLLEQIHPADLPAKQLFVSSFPTVRLDAFENYIRGTMATSRTEKIRYFREANRLNPNYPQAALQLGRSYYENREYESAVSWLARIPRNSPFSHEASFFLGLSAYYAGDFAHAEEAFAYLANTLPLTEIYNNLGVVQGRRGKRSELENLQKAISADPSDPDYHFNLAVAYYRIGDHANAARQLREVLNLKPSDGEARAFLDVVAPSASTLRSTVPGATATKIPLQRIKRNYDENPYRQLALEIQRAAEMRLQQTPPPAHARYHVERGQDLMNHGFPSEAEREFREAILLDPTNAAAHVGLARALEANGNSAGAASEANAAVRMQPSAEAFLVMARLNLKQNRLEAASEELSRALALEPSNPSALELKKTLDAKTAEKK